MIVLSSTTPRRRKVSRTSVVVSLAAATVLALSACGGSTPDPGASTKGEAPAAAVNEKPLTEPELTAILNKVKNDKGEPLKVLTSKELADGAEMQKAMVSGMTIDPEICKTYADANAQMPDSGVTVGGSWTDATTGVGTVVSLFSAEPKLLDEALKRSEEHLDSCSKFTIAIAGQSIETTVKGLDVDTKAAGDSARLISQVQPDGSSNNTTTVEGVQGSLLVSVVQVGSSGDEAGAKDLAKIVDQLLDASS